METVTKRKQIILDALDEQIEDLEERLKKAQPMIDELASLRRTRATLLDERRPTGGGGRANAQLSMETVIQHLKANGPSTPLQVAEAAGVNATIARSHFNRYADVRYRKNGNGTWSLIGESTEEEDDDGEE
jgi:hypothetical protein